MADSESQDRLIRTLRVGAEALITGGAAAGGSLLGGATGDFVGGAAAPVLMRVVDDMLTRFLSARERFRVDKTARAAIAQIQARTAEGDRLREDGYFEPRAEDGRSSAEETFESVLLKAKQEAQEPKLMYLANVLANAAFAPIPAADIHTVLKIADQMSYRQFALLSLAKRHEEFGFNTAARLRQTRYTSDARTQFVLRDWEELRSPAIGVLEAPAPIGGPGSVRLTSVGEACFALLGLVEFPRAEIEALIAPIPADTF